MGTDRSIFVGHPGAQTDAVHLVLGRPGRAPERAGCDDDELDPMLSARGCLYEDACG